MGLSLTEERGLQRVVGNLEWMLLTDEDWRHHLLHVMMPTRSWMLLRGGSGPLLWPPLWGASGPSPGASAPPLFLGGGTICCT